MKKSLLFSLFLSTLSYAQEVIWQKDIISNSQDLLSDLSITIDRQFLASGSSISQEEENQSYQYRLVKLNQRGQKLWDKTYGGYQHDFLKATSSTQEGGFIVLGTSFSGKEKDKQSDNFGGSDLWLLKLSENGEEEWQKSIGTKSDDEAISIVQSIDLGYFVGASTKIKSGFGAEDAWIIKLDKKGKIQHQILLGGMGVDRIEVIIPTKDGGCLVGIYSKSEIFRDNYNQDDLLNQKDKLFFSSEKSDNCSFEKIESREKSYGEGDYWIVKLDKNAKVEWQKKYGGKKDDRVKILTRNTNGYLIAGESLSDRSGVKSVGRKNGVDLWVIAIDEQGNEVWQKSYDFGTGDVLMSADTIWDNKGVKAKGFLVGGFSRNAEENEENDKTFWLLYIDDEGKEVWRKYIKGKEKQEEERLISAKLLTDGTYILAGTSAIELGVENWKIIKLGDQEIESLMEKKNLKVYPNPASEYIYVEIDSNFKEAEIFIYDMAGALVYQVKTNNAVTKINTSNFTTGVYIINTITENNKQTSKFIKK